MGALINVAIDAEQEIMELRNLASDMIDEMEKLGPHTVFLLEYYQRRCEELGVREVGDVR